MRGAAERQGILRLRGHPTRLGSFLDCGFIGREREGPEEIGIGEQFKTAVVVLDDGGEGLDPIAAVEVVDVAE
jgi:hypothetical protein